MDFQGIAVYPLISIKTTIKDTLSREDAHEVGVSSWVRLKRNKRYYYVLCQEHARINSLHEYNRMINSHLEICEKIYYLWELPEEAERTRLKANRTLLVDKRHLSKRDMVLLNQNVIHKMI